MFYVDVNDECQYIDYPGEVPDTYGYSQRPRIALIEVPQGICFCLPSREEAIEVLIARLLQSARPKLFKDFELSPGAMCEAFVALGMPASVSTEFFDCARSFLAHLDMRRGNARMASEFNLLVAGGERLRQAVAAYPWVMDILCAKSEWSWRDNLFMAIVEAQPLNRFLSDSLEINERAVRYLHRTPRELLKSLESGVERGKMRMHLGRLAQILQYLPSESHPSKLSDWRFMLDIGEWTERNFGTPFRPAVAARAYKTTKGNPSLFVLDSIYDDSALQLVRRYLQDSLVPIYARSELSGKDGFLWEFVLEWFACQHGPIWFIKSAEKIKKKIGEHFVRENLVLPYLDVEFEYAKDCETRRIVPLCNSGQMEEEGLRLRNCMGNLVGDVLMRGWSPYFSIRDQKNRIVAHLAVGRSDSYSYYVREVLGPDNAQVDRVSLAAAKSFIKKINKKSPKAREFKLCISLHGKEIVPVRSALARAVFKWRLRLPGRLPGVEEDLATLCLRR